MKVFQSAVMVACVAAVSIGINTAGINSANAENDRCTTDGNSGAYLGINGQPAYENGIQGVRVVSDQMRRDLYLRSPNGGTRVVHFRVGYDIITRVNGRPVYSPDDILAALSFGVNSVDVYDSFTGNFERTEVFIEGSARPCRP